MDGKAAAGEVSQKTCRFAQKLIAAFGNKGTGRIACNGGVALSLSVFLFLLIAMPRRITS